MITIVTLLVQCDSFGYFKLHSTMTDDIMAYLSCTNHDKKYQYKFNLILV